MSGKTVGSAVPSATDTGFMSLALAEARTAAELGEVPVGAVIVKDGAAHDGSLRQEDIAGTATVCGEPVPLHSLACWRRYYALMGRAEKAKLLGSLPENH